MKTTSQEYYNLLHQIQDENAPSIAVLLPGTENIYEIDLNKRTIESPEFLSVSRDHKAETIYFKCPRYFDNIDLTNLVCVVEYINANGDGRVYAVPYYDVDSFSLLDEENDIYEPMILFPWCIDGEATKIAGEVTYAIRFYQLNDTGTKMIYNLNTLTSKSKVLHGIEVNNADFEDSEDESNYLATCLEQVMSYAKKASDRDLYWISLSSGIDYNEMQ
jgi:hypothetical protein